MARYRTSSSSTRRSWLNIYQHGPRGPPHAALAVPRQQLSGTVPTEIGNLTQLAEMYLSCNLSGTVPTEMGRLTRLTQLWLHNNQISGTLPTELNLINPTLLLAHDHAVPRYYSSSNATSAAPRPTPTRSPARCRPSASCAANLGITMPAAAATNPTAVVASTIIAVAPAFETIPVGGPGGGSGCCRKWLYLRQCALR